MTSPLDASPDPLITLEPTRRVTLREAFGVDSDMTVPAFAERDSHVPEIDEAYRLLAPMMGVGAASVVFGIALLASGQNSTVTGTLAGQIVMEGFLQLRLPVWLRRLVTRLLAIVPAVIVVGASGDGGATRLLVLSQVILSLQLPFAVIPLVAYTADRRLMGGLAAPRWLSVLAWGIATVIVILNGYLLWGYVAG